MNVRKNSDVLLIMYDRILLWLTFGLLTIGLVMVTSASMSINQYLNEDLFYFTKRDIFYILLSCMIVLITLSVPMHFWQRYSNVMLIISVVMLLTVLLVGHSVNGASRWITLGSLFYIQPAELTKLSLFCYLSSYLMRKVIEVRNTVWGFCKPIVIISIISILLLAQPDLGTVIVLFITTLAMLFLVGTKMWQFLGIIIFGILTGIIIITSKQYRMSRIISFWNPWEDPFGRGYQLTQSLMAFGRGQLLGQGLGNSVQKLKYLPEAHTDFIFSIIGEELGYIGVVSILLMIFFLAFRAMLIGHRALKINQRFSGLLAIAIGIWFGFQVFVNVGTAVGMLPTKGLTLPLISYGGSSLSIMSIAVSFLLRIDYETRLTKVQAFIRN